MKNGTFIIIEKNGVFVAAIRRADSGIVELDIPVTPDIQKLDGRPCEYLLKGDKIVKVDGRDIYKQQKQQSTNPAQSQTPAQTDWRQKMREPILEEPEIIENMERPKLSDSFDLLKTRVPQDTRNLKIGKSDVHSFSLKLNQFARWDWHKEGNKPYFFNPKRIEDGPKGQKITKLEAFEIKANFGCLFNTPTQLADRQTQASQALFPIEGHLIKPVFKPEWRFVTGLGGHSVYETGITLHHVYGIPYIPASSIKGVLRSWVIYSQFENNEKKSLKDETFCHVFGCPAESVLGKAHQGKVTFFDALPLKSPTIEPDIMNPHYPKWYGGTGAPVDTDSPNPVFFLTVRDTPFQFLLGAKEWNLESKTFWDDKTLGWWLENALSEHGVGAKTAVGYGYMKKI